MSINEYNQLFEEVKVKPFIICNQIKTPDGTILRSRHVHDYKSHVDKNGETYFTDGGDEYLRRSVNKDPYQDMTIYSDMPIEDIRFAFEWGTRGKDGNKPLKWILLCEMSDIHIQNVIIYLKQISKQILGGLNRNISVFERELIYRKKCGITIEENHHM